MTAYETAHTGAVLVDHTGTFGRFTLTDRDRLNLLHRMSTNDMNSLQPGEGRATVLLTALARIIDQLIVYHRGETALAITGAGRIKPVRMWLQKHIFFNDKVQTRDVSAELLHFGLYGARAAEVAERLAPGAAALPLHHFKEITIADQPVMVARSFPMAGGGYTIIAPEGVRAALIEQLRDVPFVAETDYDLLRIESGIPAAGYELTEDYIPLETGLWEAVSFRKGCYIGQEIIARMESRNKLARTLVMLRLPEPVAVGAALTHEGKAVGSVTSIATLPDGSAAALGYIRTDALDQALQADDVPVTIIKNMQPEVHS
jgi:tRNA-modifying protein YgfZ